MGAIPPVSRPVLTPHEIKNLKTQMTIAYLPRLVRPAPSGLQRGSRMLLSGLCFFLLQP